MVPKKKNGNKKRRKKAKKRNTKVPTSWGEALNNAPDLNRDCNRHEPQYKKARLNKWRSSPSTLLFFFFKNFLNDWFHRPWLMLLFATLFPNNVWNLSIFFFLPTKQGYRKYTVYSLTHASELKISDENDLYRKTGWNRSSERNGPIWKMGFSLKIRFLKFA